MATIALEAVTADFDSTTFDIAEVRHAPNTSAGNVNLEEAKFTSPGQTILEKAPWLTSLVEQVKAGEISRQDLFAREERLTRFEQAHVIAAFAFVEALVGHTPNPHYAGDVGAATSLLISRIDVREPFLAKKNSKEGDPEKNRPEVAPEELSEHKRLAEVVAVIGDLLNIIKQKGEYLEKEYDPEAYPTKAAPEKVYNMWSDRITARINEAITRVADYQRLVKDYSPPVAEQTSNSTALVPIEMFKPVLSTPAVPFKSRAA